MDLFDLHQPEINKFESSAYYWWFRFLRLAQSQGLYGPDHPLWDEFGDVGETVDFWDWWIEIGEDLFHTGALGVDELVTNEDIETARKEGAIIVRVDPWVTRDYLRFFFEEFLDEKQIGIKPGRRKHAFEVKTAKRPFERRPDIRSLENSYNALTEWQKSPRPSLYKIGETYGMNRCADIEADDPPKTIEDKKNRMRATVSRYVRWGKSILAGVTEGKFPVM